MPKTIVTIILLIVAIGVGIGVTMLATPLLGGIDQQTQIVIAVVLSISSFISLYFMSKGHS